jgi:3-hydroxyisobutyrate dehydrogenase
MKDIFSFEGKYCTVQSSNYGAYMEKPLIGWIGTGVMGRWMCHHLLSAGYPMVVYNRTASKAQPLLEEGALWALSPADVAKKCDWVFSIVGYPKDVEETYLGENGLFSEARKNQIFVDMTTTKPSLAIELGEKARDLGCTFCDAPVSGGDVGAREATLSIMAGTEKETFETLLPLFSLMGKTVTYEGKAGSGQHTKMANQIAIAGTMGGVCEALLYAKKAGLDLEILLETIRKGAAGCWTLDNLAPRVLTGNFNPGFSIDHFVKDMGIALEESEKMGLCLPTLSLIKQLYVAMQGSGQGKLGTQALILALDRLSQSHCFTNQEV